MSHMMIHEPVWIQQFCLLKPLNVNKNKQSQGSG